MSCAFLDASHIIVTGTFWEKMFIYHVDTCEQEEESNTGPNLPVVALSLLSGAKDCRVQESSIPEPPPSVPFWPDPSHRVTVVHFNRESRFVKKGYTSALILIPYTTLRDLVEWASHDSRSKSNRSTFPVLEWNRWGQRDTLLLTVDIENPGMSYHRFVGTWAYGSRVSVLLVEGWLFRGPLLTFDLNPWAAKFARHSDTSPPTTPIMLGKYPDPREWEVNYKELLNIDRALLPHAVYHGPYFVCDIDNYTTRLLSTHNGFVALVSSEIYGPHSCSFANRQWLHSAHWRWRSWTPYLGSCQVGADSVFGVTFVFLLVLVFKWTLN